MSIALTFVAKDLLDSAVVGPEGAIHYSTITSSGMMGRKVTTINSASGLVGMINWREKEFVINGVQRKWDHLKSRGELFSAYVLLVVLAVDADDSVSEREWNWGPRPFTLKYHDFHKELLATPNMGNATDTVRFMTYNQHLFHENERATIYFPYQMQDEFEKMFLLMAILETETHRLDVGDKQQ
ncbi:hypothetical protein DFH07DRAFT_763541 [Mycena maculata]|uniref:Uncharacterized protein n=1 Tax=Mycena maculata TaxID=230809 RepID=A0AAD7KG40_9AGAR|nr:hypothetical protein DFH07DRAFT_763541 [Mycena maculata]